MTAQIDLCCMLPQADPGTNPVHLQPVLRLVRRRLLALFRNSLLAQSGRFA